MTDVGFEWQLVLANPRRVRLAYGLACARHVVNRLSKSRRKLALSGLEQGWRWILRPQLSLHDFEEKVEPKLLANATENQRVMRTVLSAVHWLYVCARFPAAVFQDPPTPDVLAGLLVGAQAAATDGTAERQWQANMLRYAIGLSNEQGDALGPIVRPGDFGFAEDNLDENREARRSKREDLRRLTVGDLVPVVVRSLTPDRAVLAVDGTDDLAYLPLHQAAEPAPASFDGLLKPRQALEAWVLKSAVGGGFALFTLLPPKPLDEK